ncbi:MAG: hypothetical protein WB681_10480 [Candidatus Cybelea sp.]
MRSRRLLMRGSLAALAVVFLSACAQHGNTMLPSSALARVQPDLVPPNCKGQKTTKQYASLTVTLSTQGGSLCIPSFGGFGGKLKYPSANPSVKFKLISSTTNYNQMPELGQGTAMFYLQVALSGGTSFGGNVRAGGGLTSATIVVGNPYTAYGQAKIDGFKLNFGPCYTIATKGKYGGVIGGIGTLLKGVRVPAAANGVIEIYSGQQTSKQC